MVRSFLVLSVLLSSSLSFAQLGTTLSAETMSALNCNASVNKALTNGGFGYVGAPTPFVIGLDGKVVPTEQERIISRESKGNVETIVFKEKQMSGYVDGKPVFEYVRSTVVLKRENGQVVSIEKPYDLKKQAAMRMDSIKKFGVSDFKLIKSTETSFKSRGGSDCQVDQKMNTIVQDEKGTQQEIIVNYDSAFCERIKPTLDRVGANNAAECGHLLNTAEMAFNIRRNELAKDGKKLANSYGHKIDPNNPATTLSLAAAVTACVQETQGGYPGMGGYGGMGGMMGVSGGMMGAIGGAELPQAKPAKKTKEAQGTR